MHTKPASMHKTHVGDEYDSKHYSIHSTMCACSHAGIYIYIYTHTHTYTCVCAYTYEHGSKHITVLIE